MLVASSAIFSTAAHQVGVAILKNKHDLDMNAFLARTAPAQALSMLVIGPIFDFWRVGQVPLEWPGFFEIWPLSILLLSSLLAVVINASQVVCIDKFSATGAQVLGHAKTVSVLVIAWFVDNSDDAELRAREFIGSTIALLGLIAYGLYGTKQTDDIATDKKYVLEFAGYKITFESVKGARARAESDLSCKDVEKSRT